MFNHRGQVNGPKNGLARLQRMAKTGCAVVHWERAINPTSRRLGISAEKAREYTLQTVERLVAADHVEPVQQRGVWFDVYALYRDGLVGSQKSERMTMACWSSLITSQRRALCRR